MSCSCNDYPKCPCGGYWPTKEDYAGDNVSKEEVLRIAYKDLQHLPAESQGGFLNRAGRRKKARDQRQALNNTKPKRRKKK